MFWARNVEVRWCSVCFYFVCFRFGGRFVIYFFLIAAVCLLWRECWFMFSSLLSFICCLFGSMRVFIYLCALHKHSFELYQSFFCSLQYLALHHSLHRLLFYSLIHSRTPTESLFICYSLISCHSSVTSFFSWLCHNLCWIFLFSSLCRSIYIFLIVIFRQMTTGCVLCWLKIVEFN